MTDAEICDLARTCGSATDEVFRLAESPNRSCAKIIELINFLRCVPERIKDDPKLKFCLQKTFFRYGCALSDNLEYDLDYKKFKKSFDLTKQINLLAERLEVFLHRPTKQKARKLGRFLMSLCYVFFHHTSTNPDSAENIADYSNTIFQGNPPPLGIKKEFL